MLKKLPLWVKIFIGMGIISFIATLLFGDAILSIPAISVGVIASMVSTIASTFLLSLIIGFSFGIVAVLSLFVGALMWDIVEWVLDTF